MLKIQLSQAQQDELLHTFKTSSDRRLRDRCQATLMSARGRHRPEAAQDLGVSTRTLQRWLNAYVRAGLDGLKPNWGPGHPPKIPPHLAPEIIQWVKLGPVGCGLNRANWTYAELKDHLRKTHGIRVGTRTMGDFCHRHGIRPYRPTYRFLRGDPEAQQRARDELHELKKRVCPT